MMYCRVKQPAESDPLTCAYVGHVGAAVDCWQGLVCLYFGRLRHGWFDPAMLEAATAGEYDPAQAMPAEVERIAQRAAAEWGLSREGAA